MAPPHIFSQLQDIISKDMNIICDQDFQQKPMETVYEGSSEVNKIISSFQSSEIQKFTEFWCVVVVVCLRDVDNFEIISQVFPEEIIFIRLITSIICKNRKNFYEILESFSNDSINKILLMAGYTNTLWVINAIVENSRIFKEVDEMVVVLILDRVLRNMDWYRPNMVKFYIKFMGTYFRVREVLEERKELLYIVFARFDILLNRYGYIPNLENSFKRYSSVNNAIAFLYTELGDDEALNLYKTSLYIDFEFCAGYHCCLQYITTNESRYAERALSYFNTESSISTIAILPSKEDEWWKEVYVMYEEFKVKYSLFEEKKETKKEKKARNKIIITTYSSFVHHITGCSCNNI
jgi:hypothetical protein